MFNNFTSGANWRIFSKRLPRFSLFHNQPAVVTHGGVNGKFTCRIIDFTGRVCCLFNVSINVEATQLKIQTKVKQIKSFPTTKALKTNPSFVFMESMTSYTAAPQLTWGCGGIRKDCTVLGRQSEETALKWNANRTENNSTLLLTPRYPKTNKYWTINCNEIMELTRNMSRTKTKPKPKKEGTPSWMLPGKLSCGINPILHLLDLWQHESFCISPWATWWCWCHPRKHKEKSHSMHFNLRRISEVPG